MPLLILPLLLLALLAVVLVLLPLSLWQHYRAGHARRRALGWLVALNAWSLAATLPGFLLAAWLGSVWSPDALADAAGGLVVGALLGLAGLWLTRFETVQGRLYYTPNRWMALALALLVALRIALGLWWAWHRASGTDVDGAGWQGLVQAGGLWAMGGLLLGYAIAYAWGIRRRHRRLRARGALR
ncbi:DUF1453 domain-containing protein [Marilutibacter aestuarii]|uniref:DUF1453 domain-containing protein n=1 Tax=Marilutibacter aestuarii TaxID=1706195 RepID=A0A507ZSA9_9GAMM|nr:DUF1453 domain-containing protein [Lysobacter aestuarii]TQD39887.1 DUF1453 domain-containing protein [Lysobacter aestuarii]